MVWQAMLSVAVAYATLVVMSVSRLVRSGRTSYPNAQIGWNPVALWRQVRGVTLTWQFWLLTLALFGTSMGIRYLVVER